VGGGHPFCPFFNESQSPSQRGGFGGGSGQITRVTIFVRHFVTVRVRHFTTVLVIVRVIGGVVTVIAGGAGVVTIAGGGAGRSTVTV
jgi:hypothetical protein